MMRHGKVRAMIRDLRRALQSSPPEHRASVACSPSTGERIMAALDPHERERVDVHAPFTVTCVSTPDEPDEPEDPTTP